VYKTKYDIVVISHDEDLKRCSGRSGVISKLSYQEIQEYSLPQQQKIPKFEAVLELIRPTNIILNVELKGNDCEKSVIKLVTEHNMHNQVIFSSFHFEMLDQIRALKPDAVIAYIYSYFPEKMLPTMIKSAQEKHVIFLNLSMKALTSKVVQLIHDNKLKVNAWTIDNPRDMKKYIKMGVDIITSNRPDLLKKMIQENLK
jgi:glycerophosphoryl diester phosphodiesterase